MDNHKNQSSQNDSQQTTQNKETQIGKDDITKSFQSVKPLPEATRPRKDGPGGE